MSSFSRSDRARGKIRFVENKPVGILLVVDRDGIVIDDHALARQTDDTLDEIGRISLTSWKTTTSPRSGGRMR
jgi:hypothetical protein